jgi:NADPH-dependent ferric siderophore reductase
MSRLPFVEVTDTVFLSASVKKIRFRGDFKNLQFKVGSYIDFRVSGTESRRYTVSFADTRNGILEFIVHLHGKGCGSEFMAHLKVGDKIDMNKPRNERGYYDKASERFVIFGDETSFALACSFLPVLTGNRHPFRFIFELDEENKNVPQLLGLTNSLVFPKNGSFRNEEWVSNLAVIKSSEWHNAKFILTGNVKSAQTFRKVLKDRTDCKVYLHGYWLEEKKGL